MARFLYHSSFQNFMKADNNFIFGTLCENYHGEALTTTREAWLGEISILKGVLRGFDDDGEIVFEYDIPRLGKRVDVVLLLKGIIFCLEFKAGESRILEVDIDQVLDYALDLKNFHKFSEDHITFPVVSRSNYRSSSKLIQMSVFDAKVVNPIVSGEAGIADLFS